MHATPEQSDSPAGSTQPEHCDVLVVGAGIAGLTAAFLLRGRGLDVRVVDAASRAGGVIHTVSHKGFVVDEGPNTLLDTHAEVRSLINLLDLESDRVFPDGAVSARYIVRDSRPCRLPSGPAAFLGSPLFSLKAKLRLAAEPFITSSSDPSETVAAFVRRRFGEEFLHYAVDPLVGGVHAGDPERLLVTHAFPRLVEMESRYGSLIRASIFRKRDRSAREHTPKARARIYSFRGGTGRLADALSEAIGPALKYRRTVTSIRSETHTFTAEFEKSPPVRAEAVIFAAGLRNLAPLRLLGPPPEAPLRYPPLAVVALGFDRRKVGHPLDGFGMLVPSGEGRSILGTLFSSTLFPDRAPGGHALLTSFVGGDRQPELARMPDGQLVDRVRTDLEDLLGTEGNPVFVHIARWEAAIPQYDSRYPPVRRWTERLESANPGLFFAGSHCAGISVPDTILYAHHVAARAADTVERKANHRPAGAASDPAESGVPGPVTH